MVALLLCAMLCGVASAQDGLSPISAVARVEGGDFAQALAGSGAPTILTAATATQVGGPDSFELTLTLPGKTTEDGLKQALKAATDAATQALGAKVVDSTVQPPPAAGVQGWQPSTAADKWVALRFTVAPVKVEDLATLADQISKLATDAGATNWTAIARRAAPVAVSEELVRAAVTEARGMAELTAKAAGLTLGVLQGVAAQPKVPMSCYFQMGMNALPGPVVDPRFGPSAGSSVGTRTSVEVWTAWR